MIRFACPGCKSVLAGPEENADKAVICPKCGQRMRMPRPPQVAPQKPTRRRLLPLSLGIALIGMILLAGVVGVIWLRTHFQDREPEPSIASSQWPPPSSTESIRAATVKERPAKTQPSLEDGGATVKEQPPQPLADVRGSDKAPRPSNKPPDENPPPLLPPPVEKKKEIELADDHPPELPFDLVDAINVQRAKAGVEPIFLDAEMSRACQSRAEQLARHAGQTPQANPETECVAEAAPLVALEKWLKEPKQRAAILEPRLRTFGAGFARNVQGQWFSVFDWSHGLDR